MKDSLPSQWCSASLGDLLASIEAGKSFQCDPSVPRSDQVGVVKVSAVTWGVYDENESKTCVDPERINPALFIRPGDFLFSRANTIELVGACVVAQRVTKPIMLSDKILRFHFGGPVDHWALYFLRSAKGRSEIQRYATGNQDSMRNIGQQRIRQIAIPLAPFAEQRRVVAEIEKHITRIDAAVANLERVKANLKRARASVLKAAVEGRLVPTESALARATREPYEPASELLSRILVERERAHRENNVNKKYKAPAAPNPADLPELPKGWVWATLEQLGEGARPFAYGVLVPGEHQSSEVPFVRVGDIGNGAIMQMPEKYIAKNVADKFKRTYLVGGEILMSIVGTIGRAAIAPPFLVGANVARAVGVMPISEFVNTHYILAAILSADVQGRLIGAAHEVARKTLNMEDVRVTAVPLPPLAEQHRIVAEVERRLSVLDALEQVANRNLTRCNRLRQSILKRAFEGKLVPQDPNDEPAEKLLARIRAQTA